jgi:hypothetical protein
VISAIIGLLLGAIIGAGCRFFDIPAPAARVKFEHAAASDDVGYFIIQKMVSLE